MAYKVIVTESAESDIDSILDYIVNELGNPDAAISLANAIEEKYDVLMENPFAYEGARHETLKRHGYRRIVMENFVLLYLVDDEQKEVFIARVFYGRQDYGKYI